MTNTFKPSHTEQIERETAAGNGDRQTFIANLGKLTSNDLMPFKVKSAQVTLAYLTDITMVSDTI